jgi:hypothetical protein
MFRRMICAAGLLAAVLAAGEGVAGEDGADKGDEPGADDRGERDDTAAFLTGLDFSYWSDGSDPSYGPGLTWGIVLLPGTLELGLSVGAMLGPEVYTIPIELRFGVPFAIVSWLDLYVSAGPTLLFDRDRETWRHDIAASVSLGLEIKPPGFDWGIRLQGDYNIRLVEEIVHLGGFTVGFLYRF